MYRYVLHTERGSTFTEFALIVPIVLIILFLGVWLSLFVHAKASVTAAVNQAVRLGVTRSDSLGVGKEMISRLHANPFWTSANYKLFCHNIDNTDCRDFYNTWAQTNFAVDFENLPIAHRYVLLYAHEGIRLSIGNSVRYPCEPDAPDGGRCLACQTLPPNTFGVMPDSKTRTVLQCDYNVQTAFDRPITALFAATTSAQNNPRYIISRRMFFDMALFSF